MVDRSPGGYVPERGHIVWLQFDPRAGHEQSGRRPALVVSPEAYDEKVGLALMCPIASKAKGYPFEVELPTDLTISGVVLADQIRSLDWRVRLAQFECQAPDAVLAEVIDKIRVLIT